MVIKDSKPVVAQYGQWDGYPSGQGSVILNFLRNTDMDKFNKQLNRVRFINPKKEKEIKSFLKSIGCKDSWMNMDQSAQYKQKYPLLSRDNGGAILEMITNSKGKNLLWVSNNSEFAGNSLFCEWAYVIDLDKGTFGVYKGFNQSPLTEKDRFFYLQDETKSGYYPVKKLTSFSLKKLPTVERFVEKCNKLSEVEEEA